MILHSYVEQVMTMCRIHVQEKQLSLSYFLSYLPLMIKATMPSILNTVRDIFMRLYGSVEEVATICLVFKIWRLLCSYPLQIAKTKNPGFGFFVKIHLLESSKLDL